MLETKEHEWKELLESQKKAVELETVAQMKHQIQELLADKYELELQLEEKVDVDYKNQEHQESHIQGLEKEVQDLRSQLEHSQKEFNQCQEEHDSEMRQLHGELNAIRDELLIRDNHRENEELKRQLEDALNLIDKLRHVLIILS